MNIYDDAESPGFDPSDHPDLTPLIDCVMLLLVFFMITTAFYALRGLEVVMPPVSATAAAPGEGREIRLTILADRRTPHGHTLEAMEAAQRAGIHRVYLATRPRAPGAAPEEGSAP